MAVQLTIKVLLAYLAKKLAGLWATNIQEIKRLLLQVLGTGQPVDVAELDALLANLGKKQNEIITLMATKKFQLELGSRQPNLFPLKEILKEKEKTRQSVLDSLRRKTLEDAKTLQGISKSEAWQTLLEANKIGRRMPDGFRTVAIKELEKAYLKGGATALSRGAIAEQIKQTYNLADGQRFPLPVKPFGEGNYRMYKPEVYADLVAVTTTNEANTVAQITKAKEIGTELIQYNSKGKNYAALGDDLCGKIDGKVFSLNPQGTPFEGKRIEYIFNILRPPYLTPHPYCYHTPRPIFLEDVRASDVYYA